MFQMITALEKYIHNVLGEAGVFNVDEETQKKIPYALASRYSVYVGEIYGHNIYFALDNTKTTPSGYEKESRLFEKITGNPVVLVMEDINPVDVHRLIQKRIDFIVPGKRMFMPSLLVDLGGRYAKEDMPETIPPLAQLIILFHLQKANLNGFDAKELADKFGTSYLTASRAVKWLGEKITPLKANGRKYLLDFPESSELLTLARPYLRSPVVKVIRTDDSVSEISGVLAGESALEEYSMLAAVGECRAIKNDAEISVYKDNRGVNTIEKWMYDPEILADGGLCDKMSLILSMKDNPDERIHKEIEILKKEWND